MSRDKGTYSGGDRKFDAILDKVIDTHKIDLRHTRSALHVHLEKNGVSECNLIIDLIIDYFRSERYPDAKVLQCELADMGLVNLSKVKRIMRWLWFELLDQLDSNIQSDRYQRTTATSGSCTKATTGGYVSDSNSYYSRGNYYNQAQCYSHATSHL